MLKRRLITVGGVIQGIGMRPFIYCLADDLCLTGHVCNDGRGVTIEIQGAESRLDRFEERLQADIPPAGKIVRSHSEEIPMVADESTFVINLSAGTSEGAVSICADRWVCPECLKEMNDPEDRRYQYPFINCTHCGPRFTIVKKLPYDRPQTTMKDFELCEECLGEYKNPRDRRYHAQPVACPVCGPRVWIEGGPSGAETIVEARRLLLDEKVVAIKGIGGFHLAVNAHSEKAVARLREFKRRPRKPLAIMVRDIPEAHKCIAMIEKTRQLLISPCAPIVLAPRNKDCKIAANVAPHLDDLGVMLPYSPLHHLLFNDELVAIVMTSGNAPGEPITIDNQSALESLKADAYLMHNRDIHVANDDSVIRAGKPGPLFLRRSRGYVPEPLAAPHLPNKKILALGALWKVTLTTLTNHELVVGRHLGNLYTVAGEKAFHQEIERMLDFARIEPEAVAVDAHPDLSSSLFAGQRFNKVPIYKIQHHHAHMASVLAEHKIATNEQVAGIILDGLGYGLDGELWGGEILLGGYTDFQRAFHLRPVPLPGGDRASKEPTRMATSLLVDAGINRPGLDCYNEQFAQICKIKTVSPLSSSAGRLFDGIAGILGIAPNVQDYEGEAATRLEAVADPDEKGAYPCELDESSLDTRTLVHALVDDNSEIPVRAARFHNGLANGLCAAVQKTGMTTVALAGGCMINRHLARRLIESLEKNKLKVLMPQQLPPGDGGLSAGQAACAACMADRGVK
jgi:hydrogenase maturation protein HypF